MNFQLQGFLSDEARLSAVEQGAAFSDLYELAYGCSAVAMSMAALLLKLAGERDVIAGTMFARCVAQFQGAVILAERGLAIESLVLSRALVETVFVFSAVAQDKVTPQELAASDFANRRKIGNAFLALATEDQIDKLKTFIAEHAGAEPIGLEAMATKGQLKDLYRLYRYLSHFAAHPSISAATPHYVDFTEGNGHVELRVGCESTPKAITSACRAMIIACAAMEHITTEPEINAGISALHDRDVVLYEKYKQ